MPRMRRTLAGMLFALASVCASLAISGFWLQRVAFSPSQSSSLATVVLKDSAIKQEIVDVIASGVMASPAGALIGPDEATVRALVTTVANNADGARLLGGVIEDAHARLIGASDEPVTISADDLVLIVRHEAAADVGPITLDVPQVKALDVVRQTLTWLVPATAIAALALLALGFLAHPDKLDVIRGLGFGMLVLAALLIVLGYVVPVAVVPALSDNPWVGVAPQLAKDSLPVLAGLALVLAGGGLGCLVGSGVARRNRRWSQPIRMNRYGEGRRWN